MEVISSLWGDRVVIDEVEVHISENGHGRAAIAKRPDGLFCIYVHWKWPVNALRQLNWRVGDDYAEEWQIDETPLDLLYQDHEPRPGIYGTLDDARSDVRNIFGMSPADDR